MHTWRFLAKLLLLAKKKSFPFPKHCNRTIFEHWKFIVSTIFIPFFTIHSISSWARTASNSHVTSGFTSPRACATRTIYRKSRSRWHWWISWSPPWGWRISCWGLWPPRRNLNLRRRRISLYWKVRQTRNRWVKSCFVEGRGGGGAFES